MSRPQCNTSLVTILCPDLFDNKLNISLVIEGLTERQDEVCSSKHGAFILILISMLTNSRGALTLEWERVHQKFYVSDISARWSG
jgi:hypothetical protein